MIKHGPAAKEALIAQIDAIERVDGEFGAFVGGAGPEEDRVGNLEGDLAGGGGGKVAEVEGDGDVPFGVWRGGVGGGGGDLEEEVTSPFLHQIVGGFEVCFTGDGAQGGEVVGL